MDLQQYVSSCYRAWYVLSIKEESWGLPWCPVVEPFCSQQRGYWTGNNLACDGAKKKKKVMGGAGGFWQCLGPGGILDPNPTTKNQPPTPALEWRSLNNWTTRKVPDESSFIQLMRDAKEYSQVCY